MKTWFVTGTDTEVGKTTVTMALLKAFNLAQRKTIGLKPIASGATFQEERLVNEDARILQSASSINMPYECINPWVFEPAIAPHIAAKQAGQELEITSVASMIQQRQAQLADQADVMLIEGAGGYRVPLNEEECFSGIPKALECPVILVVGMRLGCINHALLTAEAILNDKLTLAGWVANPIDQSMDVYQDNLHMLKKRLPCPLLGIMPRIEHPDRDYGHYGLNIDRLYVGQKDY